MKPLTKIALKQTIGFFVEIFLWGYAGYLIARGSRWFMLVGGIAMWVAITVGEWIKDYAIMKYKEDNKL